LLVRFRIGKHQGGIRIERRAHFPYRRAQHFRKVGRAGKFAREPVKRRGALLPLSFRRLLQA
jgi:hypothetical protein